MALDLVALVAVEAGPLPLGFSLAGIGRVARTISRLWEVSLPFEGSLSAAEGLVASLVVSFSFSMTSSYVAS